MEFDDFFDKEFKAEYIADGDWTKITFCGQEFGMSHSPDYEIENFRDIVNCTWDYQQQRITKLENDLAIAVEALVKLGHHGIDFGEGVFECEVAKVAQEALEKLKGSEK